MTAVAQDPAVAGTGTPDPATAGSAAAVSPETAAAVAPAAPVTVTVPETYTLTLPEKSVLDPKVTERLIPVLKDLKVTSDADAQKVVDALAGEASEVIRVYEAARAHGGELHKAMVAGFTKDATEDPFLGNGSVDALNALSVKAGELLAHYGPEYAARLKETGEAVHPAFLRMMKRIASDLGERTTATGAVSVGGEKSWAQSMYPGGIPLDTGAASKTL
jgi:hypothetical protein